MGAEAKLAEEKLGNILIPTLTKGIDLIVKYGTEILIFVGTIVALAAAIKIATTVTKLWTAATAIQETVTAGLYAKAMIATGSVTVFTAAEAAAATETGILVGAVEFLSAAMAANPIGAFIVALGLAALAAKELFGWLNKSSDQAAKMGVVKTGYSGGQLHGGGGGYTDGFDKAALAKNKAMQATNSVDAQEKARLANANRTDAQKAADGEAFRLSGLAASDKAKADKAARNAAAAAAKADAAQKKATLLSDYKAVANIYKDMNKVILQDADRKRAILKTLHANEAAAEYSHTESLFNLNRGHNEDLYRLKRDRGIAEDKLNRSAEQKETADLEKHSFVILQQEEKNTDAVVKIKATAAEKIVALTKASTDKITQLTKTSVEQQTADIQNAADKQKGIVQKSIALLTNAFNQATGLDIGKEFADSLLPPQASSQSLSDTLLNQVKDGVTASVPRLGTTQATAQTGLGSLMTNLKAKLVAANQLSKDASDLAAKGFSQSFIQSVVSQGTTVGDKMSQAILNSSPETIGELKSLYSQIEIVSEQGVTKLATQMNSGAKLATSALTEEYAQVAVDLRVILAKNSADLATAIAKESADLATATADENTILTKNLDAQVAANASAIAAIDKTLSDSRKANKQTLDNGLADQKISYDTSLEDMNTALGDALFDANKTLKKALKDAQEQFKTDIQDTTDATMKSLGELQTKLKEVALEIKKLAGIKASVKVLADAPASDYLAKTKDLNSSDYSGRNADVGNSGNVTIHAPVTVTTPQEIPSSLTSLIKLGTLSLASRAE